MSEKGKTYPSIKWRVNSLILVGCVSWYSVLWVWKYEITAVFLRRGSCWDAGRREDDKPTRQAGYRLVMILLFTTIYYYVLQLFTWLWRRGSWKHGFRMCGSSAAPYVALFTTALRSTSTTAYHYQQCFPLAWIELLTVEIRSTVSPSKGENTKNPPCNTYETHSRILWICALLL